MIESTRQIGEHSSTERRYYISSLGADASEDVFEMIAVEGPEMSERDSTPGDWKSVIGQENEIRLLAQCWSREYRVEGGGLAAADALIAGCAKVRDDGKDAKVMP